MGQGHFDKTPSPFKRPVSALIQTIMDGRFLRMVFLALLGLSVGTIGYDFQQLRANAPEGLPGSQRLEPAPMQLPTPGDQTRPYLRRTMPLGPSRGKPNLPGYFGPLDGEAMSGPISFHLGDRGRASAVGTIEPGAAERFEAFLNQHKTPAGNSALGELFIHSPGGSVSDALAIGRMLREAGISTHIPADGYCASSCPLVLAGGLYRKAGPRSFVGVHQVFALPTAVGSLQRGMADAQTISSVCQQYLKGMDVDATVWIKAMATPPAQLYLFTPEELSRLRLANNRQRIAMPNPRPSATEEIVN